MRVNGVNVTPTSGHAVVLVPSDVGHAIHTVHQMLVSSSSAGLDLGGIPLSTSTSGNFQSSFNDATNAAAQQFQSVNLDAIKSALLSKLNLGPFSLAGEADVRLANGVAILDAQAELPSLSTDPGGQPIRAGLEITGQPDGSVSLSGIHLHVPDAYLGAVHLQNLDLA
jgi:hypothetical protein